MISLEEMKRKRLLHMQKIVCAAADFYHAIQIHSKGSNYLLLNLQNKIAHCNLSSLEKYTMELQNLWTY